MTGLGTSYDSLPAQALLWGVLVLQVTYASIVTTVRPHVDQLQWATEMARLWLQSVSVLCAVLLMYAPSNAHLQQVRRRLQPSGH